VKRTSLTRRLAAGAAGLMIGLAGVVALATPASAQSGDSDVHAARWGKQIDLTGSLDCDGVSRTSVVTWRITTPSNSVQATVSGLSSEVGGIEVDDVVPPDGSVQGTQTFPSGTVSASLTVELEWAWQLADETLVAIDEATTEVSLGECTIDTPPPTVPPPPTQESGGFVAAEFDCDVLVMSISNDSGTDAALTVVPSEGDPVDVTVPDGETVGVEVPSAEDLIVDLHRQGTSVLRQGVYEITSELWTEAGCDQAEEGDDEEGDDEEDEGDDEGTGGELPVTGASTGLIVLGALVLLAIGGVLFLVARRRRVTFTP